MPSGNKPISEPMLTKFYDVTGTQWVNGPWKNGLIHHREYVTSLCVLVINWAKYESIQNCICYRADMGIIDSVYIQYNDLMTVQLVNVSTMSWWQSSPLRPQDSQRSYKIQCLRFSIITVPWPQLTSVTSLEAAAALMWRLGWRTVLVQSNARAKVPTDLKTKTGES